MKAVQKVKINELISIFKNGEPANAIQVARIIEDGEDTSCQFNIIVGKGLHNIGDEVLYIQPDYCIPNSDIFGEYYTPFGDPSKSKLGKNGRIKAVKFNFNFEDDSDPIYSNGIILPLSCIPFEITDETDLEVELGVVKYVAQDLEGGNKSGLTAGDLPSFLYPTDEIRAETKFSKINQYYEEGEVLSFSIKRDGSSTTMFEKLIDGVLTDGVCSRNLEKKLDQNVVTGYKDGGNELTRYYDKESKQSGFYNIFTETFYTEDDCISKGFEKIETEVRDAWVDTIKEKGYLTRFREYCLANGLELALRGELTGQGNKGSGNKLNWDNKLERDIIWFGVDDLSSGFAKRINYSDPENNLKTLCEKLGFKYTEEINEGVYNYDGIIKYCNSVFKKIKEETGQIIEGIVIRSKYSNKLSVKYINPEYDAKSN